MKRGGEERPYSMRRALRRLTAVVTVVWAFSFAAAAPAEAAWNLPWQHYTQTATWTCDPYVYVGDALYTRACVIINANNYVQTALVATNYDPSNFENVTGLTMELHQNLSGGGNRAIYIRDCRTQAVAASTSLACFGPSTLRPCGTRFHTRGVVEIYSLGSWVTEETISPPRPTSAC